jgi:hypothetical protein
MADPFGAGKGRAVETELVDCAGSNTFLLADAL